MLPDSLNSMTELPLVVTQKVRTDKVHVHIVFINNSPQETKLKRQVGHTQTSKTGSKYQTEYV